MTEKILVDKKLLNVKEFCAYFGIGQTKARELLTKTNNPYTVRIDGRLYANKILLDKWIEYSTTIDIYTHVMQDDVDSEVCKMESAIIVPSNK